MIIDFGELQTMTGVADGPDAALLRFVHRRAERLVKDHVGYEVEQGTFTEYLPGGEAARGDFFTRERSPGQSTLMLRNIPVRSVTSIDIDPSASWPVGGTFENVPAGGWVLDKGARGLCWTGILRRPGYGPDGFRAGIAWLGGGASWPAVAGSVRVIYVGGLTPDELDDADSVFKLAVVQTAQKFFNELKAQRPATITAGTGAVRSESLAGQSIVYDQAGQLTGMMGSLPSSVVAMLADRVSMGKYLP